MDWKLEVIVVPVSDVDRAKAFYSGRAGFNVDHDVTPTEGMRVVQLTPPGSGCSIVIGTGMSSAEPGSIRGLQLVVPDIEQARETLLARGVDASDIRQIGPDDRDGSKFMFFEDPDGNGWAVQEMKRSSDRP